MPSNPTWTYSYDPRKSPLDKMRSLIGDTDSAKPWTLYDAEIMGLYEDAGGNVFLGAAYAAESIVAKLKGTVADKTVGDLSITYNNSMLTAFVSLSNTLRMRATMAGVRPYAGGVSYADKRNNDTDRDRVKPAIKIDGMDLVGPNEDVNDWSTD